GGTGRRNKFARQGHILVQKLLSADAVASFRQYVLQLIESKTPTAPVDDAGGSYSQAFSQYLNLGLRNERVAQFSHAVHIAEVARELMGVKAVRLFNEDLFVKMPGAG